MSNKSQANDLMHMLRRATVNPDVDQIIRSAKQLIPEFITQMDKLDLVHHRRGHAIEMACDAALMQDVAKQLFEEKPQTNYDDVKAMQLLMALVQGMFAAHDIVQDKKPPKNEIESYEIYMRELKAKFARDNIQIEQDLLDKIDQLARAVIVHGTVFDYGNGKTDIIKFLEATNTIDLKVEVTLDNDPLVALFALTASIMDTNRMGFLDKMQTQNRVYGRVFASQSKVLRDNSILKTLAKVTRLTRQKASVKEKAAEIEKKMSLNSNGSQNSSDNFNAPFVQLLGQNGGMIFELARLYPKPDTNMDLLNKVVAWLRSNDQKPSFDGKEINELYDFIYGKMRGEIDPDPKKGFCTLMANADLKAEILNRVFKEKFVTNVSVMQYFRPKVWGNYKLQVGQVLDRTDQQVRLASDSVAAAELKKEFVISFIEIMKYKSGLFLANTYGLEPKRSTIRSLRA